MKEKQPKKVKDIEKTNRLIARMILGIGLSLTIANGVACDIIHHKFSDTKDDFRYAKNNKDAYLDAYEQTDEFKTTYNNVVAGLNNRLIAREIDANTYESELEKLNDNEYTEKVLLANANEQTKAEFNQINQKYLTAEDEFYKYALPWGFTSSFSAVVIPLFTLVNYNTYVWVPKRKNDEDIDEYHTPKINPAITKKIMELDDTPYNVDPAINMFKSTTNNESGKTEKQENQEENQNTI